MIELQKEQIKEIASDLDCGMKCFCNKITGEIITMGDMDGYLSGDEENPWKNEIQELENNPDNYFEIKNMASHESFIVMEQFIDLIDNIELNKQLMQSIKKKNPFRNFNNIIDDHDEYRQKWFDFKEQKYIEWVKRQVTHFNK